jgi:4-aminobutyrate aminotransferase-like enzyme
MTAGALAVVKTMEEEALVERAARTGAYFRERLVWLQGRHARIVEVRGRGLLLGLKLQEDGAPLVKACLERGFIINCVQGDVLRFAPPLIIATREIDALIACLDDIFAMEV